MKTAAIVTTLSHTPRLECSSTERTAQPRSASASVCPASGDSPASARARTGSRHHRIAPRRTRRVGATLLDAGAAPGPNKCSGTVAHHTKPEVLHSTHGLHRHTAAFVEQAPAPEGDGEVLVIQFDGKGAPTVTERELCRRRRKRRGRKPCRSARRRGRQRRARHPRQPRRKKGDKAKNARMATMVVMHTL